MRVTPKLIVLVRLFAWIACLVLAQSIGASQQPEQSPTPKPKSVSLKVGDAPGTGYQGTLTVDSKGMTFVTNPKSSRQYQASLPYGPLMTCSFVDNRDAHEKAVGSTLWIFAGKKHTATGGYFDGHSFFVDQADDPARFIEARQLAGKNCGTKYSHGQ